MYEIEVNSNTVQMNNFNLVDEQDLDNPLLDISTYSLLLTPPMDSSDSNNMFSPSSEIDSSHTYILSETDQFSSPLPGPSTQFQDIEPYLKIVEEPAEKFRFRYKSEVAGTHGSLTGRNSDRSRIQTYPTVELHNYNKLAVIRCSLYEHNKEETSQPRQPHAHRLIKKRGSEIDDDPHIIRVNPDSGFVAKFSNMGIIHTAKKNIVTELEKKNRKLREEEVARNEGAHRVLSRMEAHEVRRMTAETSKNIDLNIVCLQFEALKVVNDIYYPLCKPVYSNSINNLKSALTGELKIVRMDLCTSPSTGGQEVFVLVEKVKKRNIKIRFFELEDNEDNDSVEIWSAEGKFNDLDVHHQYAIVFRTPPYKTPDIENDVQVFVELLRPSDGARSEPREFTYTPARFGRKRPRLTSDDYSNSYAPTHEQLTIGSLPVVQKQEHTYERPAEGSFIDPNVLSNLEELNLEEIEDICKSMPPEYLDEYLHTFETDAPQKMNRDFILVDAQSENTTFNQNIYLTHHLRSLSFEEQKIIRKFQEELIAFIKTNPSKKRISMMLEYLFENPAYISENMETVLHLLISENNQKLLPILLKLLCKYQQTAHINKRNQKGQTALHLAVESHNLLAFEHLLYIKADISIQDLEGNTIFHVAVIENAPIKIIRRLCLVDNEQHCINAVNYEGLTALHLAVKLNNLSAMKVLSLRNANINAINKKTGDTVLHMAVIEQRLDIVNFLLENTDVDIKKENFAQYSAFKLAELLVQKNKPVTGQIYKLLKSYMVRYQEEQSMSPSDLRKKYSKIKTFTDDCLNEVSEILDKSNSWHNLAESLGFGHLLRTDIFTSSKNLLQFAIKKEQNVYKIRNVLENLYQYDAVDCIDNMVSRMVL